MILTAQVQGLSAPDEILNAHHHLVPDRIPELGLEQRKTLRILRILIALGHMNLINLERIRSVSFEQFLGNGITPCTGHFPGPKDFARHGRDE